MLFCEFLTVFVVEMYCNEKNKTYDGVNSLIAESIYTRYFVDLNFLGYKVPTNFSRFESSGFTLYLW